MRFYDLKILVAALFVMFMVFLLAGVIIVARNNAYHEYTGQVIAIEKDSIRYDSTTINLKTYSDAQISFKVLGFHDFEIGETYKFETKGKYWYSKSPELISSHLLERN